MARKVSAASAAFAGSWKQRLGWIAGSAAVLTACLLARHQWGADAARAQAPVPPASAARQQAPPAQPAAGETAAERVPRIVAIVNGKEMRREELARVCMDRYGEDVLESLVNKRLIAQHCRERNIVISRREVEEEIERVAARFRLGLEQWLTMLEKERGIGPEQYAREIIWPTLALKKLAADRLQVSEDEIQRAYQSEFGEAVQARLITVDDVNVARQVHARLISNPDEFPRLARDHSTDVNSASVGGMIQPIRRHVGNPKIEQVAFDMQPGQISPVIQVGGQFALLRCDGRIPPRQVGAEQVRKRLADQIRDQKLRAAAAEISRRLQETSVIENILNDPVQSRRMPGVAATINGHPISIHELADECVVRHGEEVLDGEINRLLLEQALHQAGITISQADIETEIAHAARLAEVVDSQGRPDLKRWIGMIEKEQGVSYDLYVRDAVWPSAALKKLAAGQVQVTSEDLQKGFDANYGPRVQVRAIVLDNLRRAQEVWDKARRNPTAEFFGQLAQEYSVEASSRALKGQVPPIKKHGGQPMLEKEAFGLAKGEISGVIQVVDKYVILYCEGHTEPIEVSIEEVRPMIERDLHEKKLRLAMAERFDLLRGQARIDNFLSGSSQAPASRGPDQP